MTERDFDKLLEQSVPELPPNDIAQDVTPWRRAMGYVIAGCGMTSVTLNFWNLNIFLPLIGVICMLIGFRALRGTNRWLGACFGLTILAAVPRFADFALNTTLYSLESLLPTELLHAVVYAGVALELATFLCLWRGLLAVQRKAGVEPHAGSAAALCVWYAIIVALGLSGATSLGWIFALALLGCYVLILKSLSSLSGEIEEGGYVLTPSPVRISDGALVKGIVAVLALASLIGTLFFSRYPMDWQTKEDGMSAEATEIRAELLALGYPEPALDDLTEDDLLACRGATLVVVHEADEPMNDGREVRETEYGTTYVSTVYDVKELHLTDVGVRLADSPEQWRIFHHFRWTEDVKFRGTECIQLWPTYREIEGWEPAGTLSGRVLYDRADGTTCTAPYASLAVEGYEADSIFWGSYAVEDVFAEFSFPNDGTAQRGYVAYSARQSGELRYIVDSWVNYYHQKTALQYPVRSAADYAKTRGWNEGRSFRRVQNALQFSLLNDGSVDTWWTEE